MIFDINMFSSHMISLIFDRMYDTLTIKLKNKSRTLYSAKSPFNFFSFSNYDNKVIERSNCFTNKALLDLANSLAYNLANFDMMNISIYILFSSQNKRKIPLFNYSLIMSLSDFGSTHHK